MGTQAAAKSESALVKLGASRQVVIPKKLHDRLGLQPGDSLEVAIEGGRIVMTPKMLIEKRIEEGLRDLAEGRTLGPFDDAETAMKALAGKAHKT